MSDPLLFTLVKVVIGAVLTFWLYRDAKARDYSGILWGIAPIIALFSRFIFAVPALIIIFVVYLIIRPKGKLIKCPHCKRSIHEILFQCPFCKKDAKRECIRCLEPVPWEAEQCPYCKSRALTKGNT
ncbi:MAG TPA: hypothetical protein PLZ08_11590 [Bacillota bacterium]|jgi:RNA polymerase subunit RPABC4/transcription elongation factor Spt4|nr:hypothetical protein [Bacillota bacterium]HOL10614.1 hypothetical protein [Bacillota bacterium]HPO98581.1 hypothetical protein [Bacillota bacterium]